MEWYYIALTVVGAVLVVGVVLCFIIAGKLLKMVSRPVAHTIQEGREFQKEQEHWDFADYDEKWDRHPFEVKTFDNLTLKGEYIINPVKSSPAKVAVICHGHTWNRITSLKYADCFYCIGYDLVIYDNRYFGESEGEVCTLGQNEAKDLSEIINYTRSVFGKDAYIALHGESMGAATVLAETAIRTDIAYVVADCPFSESFSYFAETIKSKVHIPPRPALDAVCLMAKRYKYYIKKFVPKKAVETAELPICFIHGKADDFILPHHSIDMYSKCRNPLSELHLVDNAGHARSFLENPTAYREIVKSFAEKVENATYVPAAKKFAQ